MYTSANMSLTVWNLTSDDFDHTQLANNFALLDTHRHVAGEGEQVPTGGIQDAAITNPKVATGTLTTDRFAANQFLAPPHSYATTSGSQSHAGASWAAGSTSLTLSISGPSLVFLYAQATMQCSNNGVFGYVGVAGTDISPSAPFGIMSFNSTSAGTMQMTSYPVFQDFQTEPGATSALGAVGGSTFGTPSCYLTGSGSYPATKTYTLYHFGGAANTLTVTFERLWAWTLALGGS